jgi:acyl-CoA thioester hydrolase
MKSTSFPVQLNLRIDWSDMDYFGHVNNVSYFRYVQAARVNYWEQIGLNQSHKETNIGPMLASCKCDFKRPLFFPGTVTIRSGVDFIKNTSFGISHQLYDQNGDLVAEALDIIVLFDFNLNIKQEISEILRSNIEAVENRVT